MNDKKKLLEDLQRQYALQVFEESELQYRLEAAANTVDKNVRVLGSFLNETLIRAFKLIEEGYSFNPFGGSSVSGGLSIAGFHIVVALQKPEADIASEVATAQAGVEAWYRQELEESKALLLDNIASLRVEIEDEERATLDQEKKAARIAKARQAAARELSV